MATIDTRIKLKKDSDDNWASHSSFVLLNGEIGIADGQKFKIGDGNTTWANLPYANSRPVLATLSANTTLTITYAESFVPVSGTRTITIPASVFPLGTEIEIYNAGAGTVTVKGASGVTVNGTSAGSKATSTQYAILLAKCVATNQWVVTTGVTR